ncbi:LCP family protein [[Clostridium] polysaccharolyticum]|uniref:Transcriptional attenuator, LytR family n=1 Tax=[Clostridium] polysaccharolyticum TaxID=29364 RepID=A0A1H9YLS8_9FIRM|nr:LCP family protein [[Clostridium] polysaccharolyticum]SES70079.1 transcriptional attenuator, LytR family [[Clostridium] polysaccharolyticum]
MDKEYKDKLKKKRKLSKKGRRKRRIRRLLALELILIILLIPAAFAVISLSKIQVYKADLDSVAQNDVKDPNMKNFTNIVVYGVDSRANELDKNTRSDSIMVVSINKKTKDIKLSSIYRDTYVNIPDHGFSKITHAYAYGGPALSISTINRNTDLDIKDFVTVNFSALTNVIDLLGGIELDINKAELKYVNAYTRDVARINGMDFTYIKSPGKQLVTGVQATGYCRVRYTKGGDFTRAERQRTVLKAIFEKAKKSNPITLYKVANEILPQIYTSLSTGEIMKLGASLPFYKMADSQGFPFEKTTPTIKGASVVVAQTLASNVTELHEYLFGTSGYEPSGTVKEFSNQIAG